MARKRKELPLLEGIEITGVAAEGKALARVALNASTPDEKIVVFIPYGAPGDVADVKLDKRRHSYAEGHIERLVRPSDIRVEPVCPHFGVCGGCKWQHLPYSLQLVCKQQQVTDALTRIAKVELPPINDILGSEQIWHYRNKMEYTFSNKKWRTWEEIRGGGEFVGSSNALGFHIPGAFDKVLHIERCHLQDPLGDEIRNFIYDYALEHGLDFYDIRAGEGLLRTLMLRLASTGEVMVCLSFGRDDTSAISSLLAAVNKRFAQITSLLYVINDKPNDSIADRDVRVYSGRDYIEEEMEGLRFRVNAKSFYQTNSRQAYTLYKVARRMAGLEPGSNADGEAPLVYDLYTGTGTIANFVARQAKRVVGIEYVEEAIADARLNAEVNGLDNTYFTAGDMKDVLTDAFIAEHGRPQVMIVDPPRAGMHPDVVEVIKRAAPATIVYVSCNPATQARDLALLDSQYRVTEVQPVDMFPHTHHVENVVRLELRHDDIGQA